MSEPLIAQKSPYAADVEAGKDYWWCACGRSESQPFCDGSHKGTGLAPKQYAATESTKVWFCGCKNTGDVPICDGSHSKI
ncbi:MAG: glutamate synthase [Rhodospirillaceae bacterium]|nr:glutamate synthase [Rhodospirillaceae bacterium]